MTGKSAARRTHAEPAGDDPSSGNREDDDAGRVVGTAIYSFGAHQDRAGRTKVA